MENKEAPKSDAPGLAKAELATLVRAFKQELADFTDRCTAHAESHAESLGHAPAAPADSNPSKAQSGPRPARLHPTLSTYGFAAATTLLVVACSGLLICLNHVPPHRAGSTDQLFHPSAVRSAAHAGLHDGFETQAARNSSAQREPAASGRDLLPRIVPEAPEPMVHDPERARVHAAAVDVKPTSEEAQGSRPARSLSDVDQARAVQQRLAELGFFHLTATGVWGSNSRQALAAFKAHARLSGDDTWNEATERALFGAEIQPAGFVGQWAPNARACTPQLQRGGFLAATINEQGAWAGETACKFQRKKQAGAVWSVVAACSDQRSRWTAHVRLEVRGDRLTWSSERGSRTYVRCQQGQLYAYRTTL